MIRATNGAALDACFAAIEHAALTGARCPMNGHDSVDSDYTSALASDGRIKVEISGRNYRTITILTGPNAGIRTAGDPTGMRVWKVVDQRGPYRINADGTPVYPPRRPFEVQTGALA